MVSPRKGTVVTVDLIRRTWIYWESFWAPGTTVMVSCDVVVVVVLSLEFRPRLGDPLLSVQHTVTFVDGVFDGYHPMTC